MTSAHATAELPKSTVGSSPGSAVGAARRLPARWLSLVRLLCLWPAPKPFEREGESLWVHCWFEPGAHLPEHFHPTLEERWETLDGTLQLKLDGHWQWLTVQDEPVPVRPGCATRFAIAAARRCVLVRRFCRPDISRSSSPTPRAARDGVFTAGGLPTSLRNAVWVAAFAQRHRDETVMTSPPPALQRIVLPILARFAR